MNSTPNLSDMSTDVDTADVVRANEFLEALGGARVVIANALKASHPFDAYDLACNIADDFTFWRTQAHTYDQLVAEVPLFVDQYFDDWRNPNDRLQKDAITAVLAILGNRLVDPDERHSLTVLPATARPGSV